MSLFSSTVRNFKGFGIADSFFRGVSVGGGGGGGAIGDLKTLSFLAYDLDDEAYEASDPIGLLTDQSGNGRNLIQATEANKPLAQVVSDHKVARFDGTNDFLRTGNFGLQAQPQTYVVLARRGVTDTSNRIMFDALAGSNRQLVYMASGSYLYFAGSVVNTGVSSANTLWHVYTVIFNGASSAFYQDGGAPKSTANPGANGIDGLTLGARYDNTQLFNGDIQFLSLYLGNLKTDNLTLLNSVCQELADRVGITWTDIP